MKYTYSREDLDGEADIVGKRLTDKVHFLSSTSNLIGNRFILMWVLNRLFFIRLGC